MNYSELKNKLEHDAETYKDHIDFEEKEIEEYYRLKAAILDVKNRHVLRIGQWSNAVDDAPDLCIADINHNIKETKHSIKDSERRIDYFEKLIIMIDNIIEDSKEIVEKEK